MGTQWEFQGIPADLSGYVMGIFHGNIMEIRWVFSMGIQIGESRQNIVGTIEYVMDSLGCRMGLPGNGISEVKYRGDVMK